MPTDPIVVTRACYDAYVKKDRASIESLVAQDFHFTSPLDNHVDRATYFERCWPNSENLADFLFIHLVQADDRVFVTYVGRDHDGHQFQNTEIVTVQGEQISSVEVYFGWSIPHKAPYGQFIDESPN